MKVGSNKASGDNDNKGGLCFVLGGARSGKSSFAMKLAERAAEDSGTRAVYAATTPASYAVAGPGPGSGPGEDNKGEENKTDQEMAARIAAHKAERGPGWDTIEEPVEIGRVVEDNKAAVLMIDCLTLWIMNLMEQGLGDEEIIERAEGFAALASSSESPVIVVSNEVGQGIVPGNSLGRRFRDLSGIVNQRVAGAAKDVFFLTAGIPQRLKG